MSESRGVNEARWGAILWDLDGTLIDTGRDLATAVNCMLTELELEPLSTERVAHHVGRGARNLVTRALEDRGRGELSEQEISAVLAVFERHYDLHLLDTTRPFAGILPVLDRLRERGERMGVVTNKPAGFSRNLLDALGLARYFEALVGGDTTPRRKPDPAPLFAALEQLTANASPATATAESARSKVVLVGDTPIDIETARNAGVRVIAVSWGFAKRELLADSRPDAIADTMAELESALTSLIPA